MATDEMAIEYRPVPPEERDAVYKRLMASRQRHQDLEWCRRHFDESSKEFSSLKSKLLQWGATLGILTLPPFEFLVAPPALRCAFALAVIVLAYRLGTLNGKKDGLIKFVGGRVDEMESTPAGEK